MKALDEVQGVGVVEQAGQAVADHQRQQRTGTPPTVVDGGYQVLRVDWLGQEVIAPEAHGMQLFTDVLFG